MYGSKRRTPQVELVIREGICAYLYLFESDLEREVVMEHIRNRKR